MQMETLDNTEWDVIIIGTGLYQSILALSLSRSNKKILHLDRNDYYGGSEAALSLNDVEDWSKKYAYDQPSQLPFGAAQVTTYPNNDPTTSTSTSSRTDTTDHDIPRLSASRAYCLALAPQLIYTDSELVKTLVSSKVYRQLEFLAMGAWWICPSSPSPSTSHSSLSQSFSPLMKIPTSREDVAFGDAPSGSGISSTSSSTGIDMRSKRLLIKVLRFIVDYEAQAATWTAYARQPFATFLSTVFRLPNRLVELFEGLTLSLESRAQTTTEWALPRLARHMRSIGRLGPGFSSVIPKWGGLAEIGQVGCRAGAVGGSVYMLGAEIVHIRDAESSGGKVVKLANGDVLKGNYVIGTGEDDDNDDDDDEDVERVSKSITIVGSELTGLFTCTTEGSPKPAGSVVIFPANSIEENSQTVYLVIHSSLTGECPVGQCIVYGSTKFTDSAKDSNLLEQATIKLLSSMDAEPLIILWRLSYWQKMTKRADLGRFGVESEYKTPFFPMDLAFEDAMLDYVKQIYARLEGEVAGFLTFEDRNEEDVDDEEEEEAAEQM